VGRISRVVEAGRIKRSFFGFSRVAFKFDWQSLNKALAGPRPSLGNFIVKLSVTFGEVRFGGSFLGCMDGRSSE